MRGYIKYVLFGMLLTGIPGSALALTLEPEATYVLGEGISEESFTSPTPILSPSPAPTLSPTPQPTPTSSPSSTSTPIPTPSPISSAEINALIDGFAGQYAVDPNVLRHIAICESGFSPNATNYIYAGLYQFGPITWKNIRSEIGEDINAALRFSAEESVQTAAYALSQGKIGIWPNCQP